MITHIKQSDTQIKGMVRGSDQKHYEVFIDLEHPRKSKCNCPHADGKRIICKHMIALYFSSYPKEAKKYYNDVIKYQEEEEQRQEELENKVIDYVHKLKKSDLDNCSYKYCSMDLNGSTKDLYTKISNGKIGCMF